MKKWVLLGILCILVILTIIFLNGKKTTSTIVEIASVKRGKITDYIKTTGRIEATEEVVIRAEVDTRIVKVLAEEGHSVQIGDELVLFDSTDADSKVIRARLKLGQAQILIQKTKTKLEASEYAYSDPSELELNLKTMENKYQQAIITRDSSKRDFKLSKELYDIQAESLINLREKEDQFKKAEIELLQAQRELEKAQEYFNTKDKLRINLAILRAEYEIALKQKELAEAELELVVDQRNRLLCTSPLKGTVVFKEVKDGMFVSVGQPMMTIADTKRLRVRAEVDELDAGWIEKEQKAIITFDAFTDKGYSGHVSWIAPQAHIKGERTVVETIIIIDDPANPLKIANQVDVKIIKEKKENVLFLPLASVHRAGDQSFVWLYRKDIAFKVNIKTGLSDMDSVEITHGLQEADKVIINYLGRLKDRDKVKSE
ncbi:MAG: efflux RND transporter periplasmic adaptor subunit [bacterium]